MTKLSTKQFEKAKKYEPQFRTAVYSRYLRAQPTSYYSDLSDLCAELNIRLNLSCPACVLNAVTSLGKMYFETKEQLEADKQNTPAIAAKSDSSDEPEQSNKSDKPKIAKKPIVSRSQKPKKSNKK